MQGIQPGKPVFEDDQQRVREQLKSVTLPADAATQTKKEEIVASKVGLEAQQPSGCMSADNQPSPDVAGQQQGASVAPDQEEVFTRIQAQAHDDLPLEQVGRGLYRPTSHQRPASTRSRPVSGRARCGKIIIIACFSRAPLQFCTLSLLCSRLGTLHLSHAYMCGAARPRRVHRSGARRPSGSSWSKKRC